MSCRKPVFTGACAALVTPFYDSGGLNTAKFAQLIDRQLRAGAEAVCVCGTTGEAATLTHREKLDAIDFCCRYADGRIKVIAGAGSNDTAQAVRLSREAQGLGADALLVVTPYYNKTTQAGLLRHYAAVTEGVDIPVILYNVPSRTGLSCTVQTYLALSQDPRVNGVKEASGDLSLAAETRQVCGEDFFLWSGNDDQVVPMMSLGAVGVISVAGNLIPEKMERLCRLCLEGRFPEAAALQVSLLPFLRTLFAEVNPIPVKAAMNLAGMEVGPVRLPLCEPSPEHLDDLRRELRSLGLLP